MKDPVLVPRAVLDGLEAVRSSGRTNMLDRPRVVELCHELGFYAAALWVHDHHEGYARGVFQGFRAEGEEHRA